MLRCFNQFGYLIYSIKEAISGMKVFLIVLIIFIMAFADSFGSLNRAQPLEYYQKKEFITDDSYLQSIWFSYQLMLGNAEFEEVTPLARIILVLATILQVIVMLNLLIAIIGQEF